MYFSRGVHLELEQGLPLPFLLRLQNTPSSFSLNNTARVADSQSVWVDAALEFSDGLYFRLFSMVQESGVWRISDVDVGGPVR